MKGKSSHHRPTQDNAGRPCDPSVEDREDDGLWLPISLPLGTPPSSGTTAISLPLWQWLPQQLLITTSSGEQGSRWPWGRW